MIIEEKRQYAEEWLDRFFFYDDFVLFRRLLDRYKSPSFSALPYCWKEEFFAEYEEKINQLAIDEIRSKK